MQRRVEKITPDSKEIVFFRSPTRLVWLGIGFALTFWLVDSWVDMIFFTSESFANSLRPTGMELYMRLMVAFQICIFGYLVSRVLSSKNRYISRIAASEERLRLVLDAANQGWFDLDLQTGEATVSPEYVRMIGYDPTQFRNGLQDWKNSIHPDDRDHALAVFQDCLNSGETRSMEYRRRTSTGEWIWICSIGKVIEWDSNKQPLRMTGIHTNITERRRMEDALREQEEFFRLIAENGEDFIAVLDLQGRRRYNNPAYGKIFGDIEALKGTDSFADIHPDDRERIRQMFLNTVNTGIGHRAEFRFVLANGEIRHMESCGGLIKSSKGEASCVVVVSHDITDRIRAEDEIRSLAFYDPLTTLPNRRLLEDRLSQALAGSKRSGAYGALLFLDLDKFKPLNDEHGHAVGDLLLIEVANRLRSCVREVDTVARIGGDEFVVIIAELDTNKSESIAEAEVISAKILATLSAAYILTIKQEGMEDRTLSHTCTASIGVTLFLNHEFTQEETIKQADSAMYKAKEHGGYSVHFYAQEV